MNSMGLAGLFVIHVPFFSTFCHGLEHDGDDSVVEVLSDWHGF